MNTTTKPARRRGGTTPNPQLGNPDYPFTMKLPDGRILFVEVPGRWVTRDRSGKPAFLPQAVKLLDRIQALAMSVLDRPPSPGYIVSLREALGLTQEDFGTRLGVDKMTVSRWERGTVRPGGSSLVALERVRREAIRKGVTIPA
ncbi:MAG TPA: helix-turn-helix domain-containing protein [Phycisphaerae bacterium]|nr:helix-turn-helix domain-containing protein [Phycisphaerae bacterium]